MKIIDYCNNMTTELVEWRSKIQDLTEKVENLGSKEREQVLPNIQDLNILVVDISNRIEELKNECPTEWNSQKKDIDAGHIDMREKYEKTLEYVGKYSPVSIPG